MCNEIFIRGKHDQSRKGEKGGTLGGKEREGVYREGVAGASSRARGREETKTGL